MSDKTMTVKDLKKALENVDDDIDVMMRKHSITGNIDNVGECKQDTYGFFGKDIPCVIIEPMNWEDDDDEEE